MMSASTSAAASAPAASSHVPTLRLYPVLGSLFVSLRPYLNKRSPLPTDDSERTMIATQIMTRSSALVSLLNSAISQVFTSPLVIAECRLGGPSGRRKRGSFHVPGSPQSAPGKDQSRPIREVPIPVELDRESHSSGSRVSGLRRT